ncbi:hypothetical protein LOAG_06917 [Loa loa]|uniref:Uncharacterized protein n=1 Tax=Loa loa TaxID=7209 RepID=A0A1S0TYG2_LOALO|nr:hypothetical protein LOAG_06917 [Loa loa]EFO21570.1 hypothetical protein LOAG_06917 [Loa loa]
MTTIIINNDNNNNNKTIKDSEIIWYNEVPIAYDSEIVQVWTLSLLSPYRNSTKRTEGSLEGPACRDELILVQIGQINPDLQGEPSKKMMDFFNSRSAMN